MSEDGYGVVETTPEFQFGTVYEWKFEASDESMKEWQQMVEDQDKLGLRFYEVFENDLMCCIYSKCNQCTLKGRNNCRLVLEGNARKMIRNQRRMYAEFVERTKWGRRQR